MSGWNLTDDRPLRHVQRDALMRRSHSFGPWGWMTIGCAVFEGICAGGSLIAGPSILTLVCVIFFLIWSYLAVRRIILWGIAGTIPAAKREQAIGSWLRRDLPPTSSTDNKAWLALATEGCTNAERGLVERYVTGQIDTEEFLSRWAEPRPAPYDIPGACIHCGHKRVDVEVVCSACGRCCDLHPYGTAPHELSDEVRVEYEAALRRKGITMPPAHARIAAAAELARERWPKYFETEGVMVYHDGDGMQTERTFG